MRPVLDQSSSDCTTARSPSGQSSTVTLKVSKGPQTPQTVTVPDVTSTDEETARATLEEQGFKVDVEHQDVTDMDLEGFVLDQRPAAGTQVTPGSKITIVVGRFKEEKEPVP